MYLDFQLIEVLIGHTDFIRNINYFESKALLVSTSNDQTARVYSHNQSEPVTTKFHLEHIITHNSRLWASLIYQPQNWLILGGN